MSSKLDYLSYYQPRPSYISQAAASLKQYAQPFARSLQFAYPYYEKAAPIYKEAEKVYKLYKESEKEELQKQEHQRKEAELLKQREQLIKDRIEAQKVMSGFEAREAERKKEYEKNQADITTKLESGLSEISSRFTELKDAFGKQITISSAPDRPSSVLQRNNMPQLTSTTNTMPEIRSIPEEVQPEKTNIPEIVSFPDEPQEKESSSFLDDFGNRMKIDNFANLLIDIAENKGIDEIDASLKSTRSALSKKMKESPLLKDVFNELISYVKSKDKTKKAINEGINVPNSIIRFHQQQS